MKHFKDKLIILTAMLIISLILWQAMRGTVVDTTVLKPIETYRIHGDNIEPTW